MMRRIDTETGLQKVGSIYYWADQAFIPQLFTQFLCDDLDHHQNVKMFIASLFPIFPKNHVTSSNRLCMCVCVYSCIYVCVLFCLLIGLVYRYPVFHRFGMSWQVHAVMYVCAY